MDKKKVLLVITKSNWGGAQRYVYDLATTLPPEQFEVTVALGGTGTRGAETGRLAQELDRAGVRVHFVSSFMRAVAPLFDLRATRELRQLFLREAPDVVHLNSSKAGGVGALAARLAGVPRIIFTSHGLPWDEDRGLVARLLIYLASRLTFALCHVVIVLSKDNLRRAPSRKVRLIPLGLRKVEYLTKESARAALAQYLRPLPQSALWLGSVGELTRNKGYRYLLEAAALLKRKGMPYSLIILGEGEERVALERQIKKERLEAQVYLPGFVPDAARLMRGFDLFVLPSLKEGMPYVLLEAGAGGVPVVATHVGGIPDVLGKSTPLPERKNAQALADALIALMSNEAAREAAAAELAAHIQTEFSLERMVQETMALY